MKIVRVLTGYVAAAAVTAMLLCAGCVSLMEKTGRALDGSAFAEKTVAVYRARRKDGAAADMAIREMRGKAGERSVVVTLDEFPALRLRGSAPNAAGEFSFSSLDYLGGSVSGWNEYRLELAGGGKLSLGGADAVISAPEPPEAVQISEGKIRRYDTRITGTEALTNLRNRRERILALVEWMKEREDAPALDRSAASDNAVSTAIIDHAAPYYITVQRPGNEKDFKDYWKPVLFPELVSPKKRPEGWLREGDARVRAEDIAWNTGYTERLFPESLRAVRNSGTLLRDWEEAFDWIYIEYEWDAIVALLAEEITLKKAKK